MFFTRAVRGVLPSRYFGSVFTVDCSDLSIPGVNLAGEPKGAKRTASFMVVDMVGLWIRGIGGNWKEWKGGGRGDDFRDRCSSSIMPEPVIFLFASP
jgi:hypothetical protein